MKIIRFNATRLTLAALMGTITLLVWQQMEIKNLKESQRRLAAQYQELSAIYPTLLTVDRARTETARPRSESAEILKLRNQLAQSQNELSAAASEKQISEMESPSDLAGYLPKEHLTFAGLDSPRSALQSLLWASMNGDFTNFLATLAPTLHEENTIEEFERSAALNAMFMGMQVLAQKWLGDDKVELKVRMDNENGATLLVIPMVAIGNEWRLGSDFRAYTKAWDQNH